MNERITRFTPWAIAIGLIAVLMSMNRTREATSGRMDLHEFGRLPIVDRGRMKPIDTLARNSLMVISGRTTFKDANDKTQPAIRWLLDTMTSRLLQNEKADDNKVFRIDNDQVLTLLKLQRREGYRYSINEIGPNIEELGREASRARNQPPAQRDLYQVKLMELAEHLQLSITIATLEVPLLVPPSSDATQWETLIGAARRMREAETSGTAQEDPAVRELVGMLRSYTSGDDAAFNTSLKEYSALAGIRISDQDTRRIAFETVFNDLHPFYSGLYFYGSVFLLTCAGWMLSGRPVGSFFHRTAFATAMFAFLIHTVALIGRMYIQGRPPVTNLYSSAVFIGWGCVGLGLLIEKFIGMGLGNIVAAITGGLSLIIANFLAAGGDTMEMMQAVLDTNFWLATHVTCVTLGYTATFVAGFLALIYIVWGMLTPTMNRARSKSLSKAIYGVVCFATLLSFVGTVLGGIWADQSWGRFWGWDPKENGAILIVTWNALILHARWGGMVKERGIALLAIVGNMVTAWSWFGTNQLGVGLHAYGFNNTLATALAIFWVSQLAIIALGIVPTRFWWSMRAERALESNMVPASARPQALPRSKRPRPDPLPG